MRLVETGWDAEVARRPHGQHTTVVVHLDVEQRTAALHLGPLLSDAERRYLSCDATGEVWFERDGQLIGAGRATRLINRRLRRALEHRDRTCAVPGCDATRGLHGHHIRHWEDGGATELANLVLLCPYHHRSHHRGVMTITGPADNPIVTDNCGRPLRPGSLARPPNPHPRWRPTPDLLASAPNGGGMNPSNPNHHHQTTSGGYPGPVTTDTVLKPKHVGARWNSFAIRAATAIANNRGRQPHRHRRRPATPSTRTATTCAPP
ncbi:hypothetical protein LAUMK13_00001 [Mycobacterium innocens]|uniref:HNH nuclease domain-containing protein n=1 Tax=Mycobacterium innocens TaxID=2341083 RepID=A0A498PNX0_9MYCO|nr:hypothetical protein LAUMK13_00001 [Mycobacterium innocens]